jgi:protein translocase SecG subunit
MDFSLVLTITQMALAVVLTAAILMQTRGAGLGAAFGGENISYTKRGAEKRLYEITIVLAAAFLIVSLLNVIL